jgi:hypothetical protein
MAFDTLVLKNPNTGEIKNAPVGFSWTTFFFGFFPAIFRGDWKWAAIMFVVAFFTIGVGNIVFAFIYNKFYIKEQIYSNGFKVVSSAKGNLQRVSSNLGIELPVLQ